MKNKIIFLGTSVFAARMLQQLLSDDSCQIAAIVTQPDRAAGRGKKIIKSPVKLVSEQAGIPVFQPEKLKLSLNELTAQLGEFGEFDLGIVAAYGQIIPEEFLKFPRLGMINVHASILPYWRGAAPIQRALMEGQEETGISLMQMDAGLDTGAVLKIEKCPIMPEDNFESLHNKLAELGAALLSQNLKAILAGELKALAQDNAKATYAHKINSGEELIDWNQPARIINNKIRALSPYPGAYTKISGKRLKIFSAEIKSATSAVFRPGQISLADKNILEIACLDGNLSLKILQLEGKSRLPVQEFLSGLNLTQGDYLG